MTLQIMVIIQITKNFKKRSEEYRKNVCFKFKKSSCIIQLTYVYVILQYCTYICKEIASPFSCEQSDHKRQ